MPPKKAKTYTARLYLGLDADGREQYEWIGRFPTKRERDEAVMRRRIEREADAAAARLPAGERTTCAEYAAEYLDRMEAGALLTKGDRRYKASSITTARTQLRRFTEDFGDRTLASIGRKEAVAWAERHGRKPSAVQAVNTLFNLAVDEEIIDRNPWRGLMRKPEGRRNQAPPTDDEFDRLVAACDVLGEYAPRMRAMLTVAAYSGMRPGELMALDWSSVDLPGLKITVSKRLYRQTIDLPKSNKVREIALLPPARDALLTLPERQGYVFRGKQGLRLNAPLLSAYWREVQAAAGLRFDFYLASKHRCVHYMKVKLGLPNHIIAAQMGWSEGAVEKMVAVYAHADVGALDAIHAAFAALSVPGASMTTSTPAT
jgi:integrase